MPLERCSLGKTSGWRWGTQGKCYKSKSDALKQGYAEGPAKFKQEMSKSEHCTAEELEEFYEELVQAGEIDRYDYYTESYVSQKTRKSMPSKDFGWPSEKKFPVTDEAHFKAAVKLLGRAPKDKQAMIKRNLIRIARERGYALPSTWKKSDDKK